MMSKLGIKIYEEIKRLKEAGVIKKIGFSIYLKCYPISY